MNVLILTPDAVGSTLLQRMLTIYMQFHNFDRPVINLHELTNGLARYYSPDFNQELVGKKAVKSWGYHQSLPQVTEMLSSVDHYKTSRLAHYHLVRRGDSVAQQIPFYNYLNENFFIIWINFTKYLCKLRTDGHVDRVHHVRLEVRPLDVHRA